MSGIHFQCAPAECVAYLQAVEGLPQVADAAPLSCCALWAVVDPRWPGLDPRAQAGTRVQAGPTELRDRTFRDHHTQLHTHTTDLDYCPNVEIRDYFKHYFKIYVDSSFKDTIFFLWHKLTSKL